MEVRRKSCIFLLFTATLLFLVSVAAAQPVRGTYPSGRYQLVSGEYDVRITAPDTGKIGYETHRTMFLIDSHTGKVWLFLVENNMFDGRWGWIPARGVLEKEPVEKGK